MLQENVDIVRESFLAVSGGDPMAGALLRPRVYEGHEGVRRLLCSFYEAWTGITVSPEEFIECGEHVVVPTQTCFSGRDGIQVEARGVFVNTLRNGRIAELRLYRDRADALKAVGLED